MDYKDLNNKVNEQRQTLTEFIENIKKRNKTDIKTDLEKKLQSMERLKQNKNSD